MNEILKWTRITDLPSNFPIRTGTLRRWFQLGKYPNVIAKIGGSIVLNMDEFQRMPQQKQPAPVSK